MSEEKEVEATPKTYKTVFILGAGASWDFGFPTGEELLRDVENVCNACIHYLDNLGKYILDFELRNSDPLVGFSDKLFDLFGQDSAKLTEFSLKLKNGLPLSKSIDNFLNDQQDEKFKNFGKMVIAAALLNAESNGLARIKEGPSREIIDWRPREINEPVDFFKLRQTWFNTFFRELRTDNGKDKTGLEAFKERLGQIAVITFNYERSFEFLMRQAIALYQTELSDDEIDEVMSCLNIVHPYGSLGTLEERPFATPLNGVSDWRVFEERIQIFMEEPNKATMNNARDVVQNAKQLVFLGFGFHEQNMEFLGMGEWIPRNQIMRIYATGYGFSEYKQKKLAKKLSSVSFIKQVTQKQPDISNLPPLAQIENFVEDEIQHKPIPVSLEPANCKELLDEYADDIFNLN